MTPETFTLWNSYSAGRTFCAPPERCQPTGQDLLIELGLLHRVRKRLAVDPRHHARADRPQDAGQGGAAGKLGKLFLDLVVAIGQGVFDLQRQAKLPGDLVHRLAAGHALGGEADRLGEIGVDLFQLAGRQTEGGDLLAFLRRTALGQIVQPGGQLLALAAAEAAAGHDQLVVDAEHAGDLIDRHLLACRRPRSPACRPPGPSGDGSSAARRPRPGPAPIAGTTCPLQDCGSPAISSSTWPAGAAQPIAARARETNAEEMKTGSRMGVSPGTGRDEADIGIIARGPGADSRSHALRGNALGGRSASM